MVPAPAELHRRVFSNEESPASVSLKHVSTHIGARGKVVNRVHPNIHPALHRRVIVPVRSAVPFPVHNLVGVVAGADPRILRSSGAAVLRDFVLVCLAALDNVREPLSVVLSFRALLD